MLGHGIGETTKRPRCATCSTRSSNHWRDGGALPAGAHPSSRLWWRIVSATPFTAGAARTLVAAARIAVTSGCRGCPGRRVRLCDGSVTQAVSDNIKHDAVCLAITLPQTPANLTRRGGKAWREALYVASLRHVRYAPVAHKDPQSASGGQG